MFLRNLRKSPQATRPIQWKRYFSTLFINGKSFIRLSTDFPTLKAITRTDILAETPYVSNNFDNYPINWPNSSKVIGTRIRLNLCDKQLKLDPATIKSHPAIQQISVNASMVTSTGQSRIIIVSARITAGLALLAGHRN